MSKKRPKKAPPKKAKGERGKANQPGHRARFGQLLDDAIFGVKKAQRG